MANGHNVEFPEAVIVNRAMIDALVTLLIETGVVKVDDIRERFQARLEEDSVEAEAEHTKATEKVAAS